MHLTMKLIIVVGLRKLLYDSSERRLFLVLLLALSDIS
jgi:hypothetical protein